MIEKLPIETTGKKDGRPQEKDTKNMEEKNIEDQNLKQYRCICLACGYEMVRDTPITDNYCWNCVDKLANQRSKIWEGLKNGR